jgi:hypothetical protein
VYVVVRYRDYNFAYACFLYLAGSELDSDCEESRIEQRAAFNVLKTQAMVDFNASLDLKRFSSLRVP